MHKLVLGPKDSVLKFNGLGDINFFKPVFTLHFPQNAKIAFTDTLIFKISRGGYPHFPLERPRRMFGPSRRWIAPPSPLQVKKLPTGLMHMTQ